MSIPTTSPSTKAPRWRDTNATSGYTGIPVTTLSTWRCTDPNLIRFHKIGNKVLYDLNEVDDDIRKINGVSRARNVKVDSSPAEPTVKSTDVKDKTFIPLKTGLENPEQGNRGLITLRTNLNGAHEIRFGANVKRKFNLVKGKRYNLMATEDLQYVKLDICDDGHRCFYESSYQARVVFTAKQLPVVPKRVKVEYVEIDGSILIKWPTLKEA